MPASMVVKRWAGLLELMVNDGWVKHTGDGGKQLQTYLIRNQSFEFLQRMTRWKRWEKCKDGEDKSNIRQEMVVTKREVGRGKKGGEIIYERN